MNLRNSSFRKLLDALDQIITAVDAKPHDHESNTVVIELELLKLEIEKRMLNKRHG